MALPRSESHWLIWDGECDFCRRTITWVQRHDRQHRFQTVPFQECPSPPMTPELRRQAQAAIQVITNQGQQMSGGRAMLFVCEEIRWHPIMTALGRRQPFIWPVELGYWIVAHNRSRLSKLLFRSD